MKSPNNQSKSLGGLWKNERRAHIKAPHLLGNIRFTKKELLSLLEVAQIEGDAKVNLAAWKNQNPRTGEHFYSVEAQAPYAHSSQRSSNATLDDQFETEQEGDLL
jgi:hypothetical protein